MYKKLTQSQREKVRFLVVGGFNTIFGLGLYPFLYFILGAANGPIGYLHLLLISQLICVSISYFGNKIFVFRSKNSSISEYGRFWLYHLLVIGVNLLLLPLIMNGLSVNPMIAQTLFSVLVIITSYVWHSKITFIKKSLQ
ncbi:MAG: GtrA family protein [Polynucleobacter sp.]|nr:GtrA family protein [Polynucleobacter sp.]